MPFGSTLFTSPHVEALGLVKELEHAGTYKTRDVLWGCSDLGVNCDEGRDWTDYGPVWYFLGVGIRL